MRYPVMNLRHMGGMLEDYQRENDAFREKLERLNQEARDKWAREHPGPVHHPPAFPLPPPPNRFDPCERGFTRSQTPPYDCLPDVITQSPFTYKPGTRPVKPGFTPEGPNVPIGVASGGGVSYHPEPNPIRNLEVPARSDEPCEAGYTRNQVPPYDCRKDTVSLPDRPPMAPLSLLPSLPDFGTQAVDPGLITVPGPDYTTFAGAAFLGAVRLRPSTDLFGAPRFIKPIRMAGFNP